MANRFGTDIRLSNDYDLIIKPDGDFMSTQDYENAQSNVRFEGYYSILTALLNRLETNPGTYLFDPGFGSNLQAKISEPMTAEFKNNITLFVMEALNQDDRVETVNSVTTQLLSTDILLIRANITLVGSDNISELVFPEMFIA